MGVTAGSINSQNIAIVLQVFDFFAVIYFSVLKRLIPNFEIMKMNRLSLGNVAKPRLTLMTVKFRHLNQTSQVSRFCRETHGFQFNLTVSRRDGQISR